MDTKPALFFPDDLCLEGYERPALPIGHDWVRDPIRRGWIAVYVRPQGNPTVGQADSDAAPRSPHGESNPS
jgi:hypothetical protein